MGSYLLLLSVAPDLESFVRSLVECWIGRERNDGRARFKCQGKVVRWRGDMYMDILTLKRLLSMLQDLEDESAFKIQPFPIVLYHRELEHRSILVDSSSGTWENSGVIDLVEAEVVPTPVACIRPIWPWDFSEEPETGFHNSAQCFDPKLNGEGQALEDLSDNKAEKALPGYHEDAYGYGRWLRIVFSDCKAGLSNTFGMRHCLVMLEQ